MANNNVTGARYSAINTMHNCRLSAWEIYRNKLKGSQNSWARIGLMAHDVLEDYGRHCIALKLDTDYEEFEKIKYRHLPKLKEGDEIKEGKYLLAKIKEQRNWNSVNQFEKVEIEHRFKLNEFLEYDDSLPEEEAFFSGAIDIICYDDDIAYPDDYKTVRAIYTQTFMEESIQRKVYSWLIFKKYPHINEVRFSFDFLRYGYLSERITEYRENLEDLENQIRGEIAAFKELMLETEPPEATPSGYCMLCPIKGTCEAYKNAFDDIERIETDEDAVRLLQYYQLAKVKLASMEKQLKFYSCNVKPIDIGTEEYGPVLEDKIEYNDVLKVIDIFEKANVPVGAIYGGLKFTKTEVNNIAKKFKLKEDVKKQLEMVATKSKTSKYKVKKKEEIKMDDEDSDSVYDPYL